MNHLPFFLFLSSTRKMKKAGVRKSLLHVPRQVCSRSQLGFKKAFQSDCIPKALYTRAPLGHTGKELTHAEEQGGSGAWKTSLGILMQDLGGEAVDRNIPD